MMSYEGAQSDETHSYHLRVRSKQRHIVPQYLSHLSKEADEIEKLDKQMLVSLSADEAAVCIFSLCLTLTIRRHSCAHNLTTWQRVSARASGQTQSCQSLRLFLSSPGYDERTFHTYCGGQSDLKPSCLAGVHQHRIRNARGEEQAHVGQSALHPSSHLRHTGP